MYIIQKTLFDKFNYYLGKDGRWEGLKDNAVRFNIEEVMNLINFYKAKRKVNEAIDYNYSTK